MPNYCFYDMHINGSPKNVDKFIDLMENYDAPKHFFRVFEATEYDRVQNNDDTVTAYVSGDCAWSVASCMTKDSPITYCSTHSEGTSLQEQSAELELNIEVFAEEQGMGFAEHYLYLKGKEEANEETELLVYQFEPSDWGAFDNREPEALKEFEEFKKEWDLDDNITPDDVYENGDIRIGGYDMEWSI